MWHLKVPKIMHIYWGGDPLSYIRFLTVKSFMHHNPSWRVILWMPQFPSVRRTWDSNQLEYEVDCDDYTSELMNLNIEKYYVDFTRFGMKNTISEVHKSDYLRLYLLSYWGGLWSDMDIIYFKSMDKLAVNVPANVTHDTFVCIGGYGHSAGFLMSVMHSEFFKEMLFLSEEEFDEKEYQGIGATMFNKYYPTMDGIKGVNIAMDAVYAHDALHVADLLNGKQPQFTEKSVGCHWYAGHPLWDTFIKNTNGGKENLPDCVIGNLLKSIDYYSITEYGI